MSGTAETRLAALVAAAHAAQSEARSEFDESRDVHVPWYLPRGMYVDIVSQLFHGERAALELCQRMAGSLGNAQAEAFLAYQIADEQRHVDVFGAYLGRLGDIRPHHAALDIARTAALDWRGSPLAPVIVTHILLEGEALHLQHELSAAFPCPLFRDITTSAARDEARHHAFGRAYLRHRLAAAGKDERIAIYRWVRRLWQECADATSDRFDGLESLLLRKRCSTVEGRWQKHAARLQEIGLMSAAERDAFERAAA